MRLENCRPQNGIRVLLAVGKFWTAISWASVGNEGRIEAKRLEKIWGRASKQWGIIIRCGTTIRLRARFEGHSAISRSERKERWLLRALHMHNTCSHLCFRHRLGDQLLAGWWDKNAHIVQNAHITGLKFSIQKVTNFFCFLLEIDVQGLANVCSEQRGQSTTVGSSRGEVYS